ncbi:MAG: MarR family transcriptional regulator [Betaproteobacteria bacterium]|nr:MarR family transcriptional regulator [Betaproteobacteria bacterium]MBU6513111.1 MarR family transcriptional regulator [Betaproteobacteria bacterium]MDE1955365.1 MarR family transcriptional regulator [Betaproteobacteria bacterium]MDE2153660.1 MarR family transcriptional regulator [Betaproteobacteria bacterium]MDE2477720.1 MarR family transcriptional regulator [Betaproteobacteria bacterium]
MPTTTTSPSRPAQPRGEPALTADHAALRLWLRLLACHNLLEAELRGRMRDQFGTTLARFDLMSQLYRYPDGLRMREVSRLLMVSGGNVTGLADRLVAEGLVERRDDPGDRRAYFLCLTPQGRGQFAAMAAQHEQWVAELLAPLGEQRLGALSELLGELKSRLGTP